MEKWKGRREQLSAEARRKTHILLGTMILTAVLSVVLCGFLTKHLDEKEKVHMFLLMKEMQKQK